MSQQIYAVSYARVSTIDQAKKEISIPAQFRRIEEWAANNRITILHKGSDEGVSAYKDNENRDGFWKSVEFACRDRRVTLFLVDDPTRFFRDRYLAVETKSELKKAGVRVVAISNPYDVNTIHGVWQEVIDEARAQTGSMETAFHTFKGQSQNIQTRDTETGWCYKNGGRAPFGYRAVRVIRGQNIRHLDIVKVIWEVDPEAAEVLRFMYLNCRLEKRMSYKAIWKELNDKGMLSPTSGRPWTISSVIEMMREDRVLQCAGWGIWNKEDHKTPGKRFKDKSEWVWVQNAHPAIITEEEASQIVSLNESRGGRANWRRTEHSQYLLTGKNAFGEDMFVCAKCWARMTGYRPSARHRLQYRCGSVHYRGASTCIGKAIDKDWVENMLLERIRDVYGTPEAAMEVTRRVNEQTEDEGAVNSKAKSQLERKLSEVDLQIKNLVRAVASGMDISEIHDEMQRLKEEKTIIENTLENIKKEDQLRPQPVSVKQVLGIYSKLCDAIKTGSNEQKRTLLRAFVRRLEFNPETDSLEITMFVDPTQSTVWYLSGAQDRT